MAKETQKSRTARLQLENGRDAEGNTKTVTTTFSGLSKKAEDWDAAKFLAIVGALEPCLNKTVEDAETVVTYSVTMN